MNRDGNQLCATTQAGPSASHATRLATISFYVRLGLVSTSIDCQIGVDTHFIGAPHVCPGAQTNLSGQSADPTMQRGQYSRTLSNCDNNPASPSLVECVSQTKLSAPFCYYFHSAEIPLHCCPHRLRVAFCCSREQTYSVCQWNIFHIPANDSSASLCSLQLQFSSVLFSTN